MQTCKRCESPLVEPIEWLEDGPRYWAVRLRCPECWYEHLGRYSNSEVEVYDAVLDDACEQIVKDLRKLQRANMAHEVEVLVAALEADAIEPFDFGAG